MRPFLLLLMLLLSWLMNSFAESPTIAKRDCPTSCGEVPIPFPFGIGASCYLDDLYAVNCSSNKPILKSINLEILDISSKESTMVVNHPVARSCDVDRIPVSSKNLENTPFFFSGAKNKFTGVGCNALVYMFSNRSVISGCISVCDKNNISVDTMGCYGIKCCQTRIPSSLHLHAFNASMSPFGYKGGTQDQCKSAFLVDQQWFETNVSSPEEVGERKHVPVVLDWGLPDSLFDLLKRNSSQIYETTSDCTIFTNMISTSTSTNSINDMSDSTQVPVLRCNCKSHYEGNPYLLQGCEDIDECQLRHQICGPEMICVNTYGGFRCYPNRMIKSKMIMLGIGIGFGALFLLTGAWWLYVILKRRKNVKLREEYFKRNGGLLLQQQLSSLDGNVDRSKLFNSKELDAATDHFNMDRILGQGGQGTVYKGMLPDGKIVAVKKSKVVDEAKIEEFINEVAILSQINHRNVVKLLGCCLETEVPLLVYEFISNGTLFQYLHNQVEELPLTWDMRIQIATEVAGALYYLHSAASLPIYHRDIKSANILLDDKYRAKVADFGTSRSIAIDQTHVTTKVQGTFGYLDPEFFQSSQFTDKSDVYSFGVVLIELLTGQKPISSTRSEDNKSLATHFLLSMAENNLFDILDPEVRKISKKEEVMMVANLAKRCLNLNGRKRPTMKEVATVLEAIRASQNESNIQQNFEEVEYVRTEVVEPWDVVSTSTISSTFEIAAPLTDVKPLLTK